MYSYQLLKAPRGCASCGTTVAAGLAGHHYQDPMCETCFRLVAPDVGEAMRRERGDGRILRAARASLLPVRWATTCANCGDRLLAVRIAGHHYGDPLCFSCFYLHAPEVAALLRLDEAARQAADTLDSRNLLTVAVSYTDLLHHLDAEHPREKAPRDPPSGGGTRR